jgi:phage-related protein
MAEVTGNFGENPIELNNAATETTLKQLLAAMMVLAKGAGKDKKFEQDLEKELKRLAEESKKSADQQKKISAEQKKQATQEQKDADQAHKDAERKVKADAAAVKATQEYEQAQKSAQSAIKNVGKELIDLASGMSQVLGALAGMDDSVSKAAGALGQIPLVGGFLAKALGPAADAAEKVYDSFKKVSSVGAGFGGSFSQMIGAASGAGLTLDQFTGIVTKNAQGLAMFGGTTEDGAKRMANIGKTMKQSGLNDSLLKMGYSTEQINDGMASYISTMSRTGALRGMSDTQVAQASAKYMKELDGLARLTGESREQKQKEMDELARDAQLNAAISHLSAEEQENARKLIASYPKQHQAAIKDMVATGNITSDAAIKFNAMMPQAAGKFMQMGRTLDAGGKLTKEATEGTYDAYLDEAKVARDRNKNLVKFNRDYDNEFSGIVEATGRQKGAHKKIAAEQEKQAADEKSSAEALGKFKQNIAVMGNQFLDSLQKNFVEGGGMESLSKALGMMSKFAMDYVVPAFTTLMNGISKVAGFLDNAFGPAITGAILVFAPLAGAVGAAIFALYQLVTASRALSAIQAMQARQAAGGVVGKATDVLSGPAGKAGGTLSKMSGIFKSVLPSLGKFGSVMGTMFNVVGRVAGTLVRFLGPIGMAIGAIMLIKEGLELFGVDLSGFTDAVMKPFAAVWEGLGDVLNTVSNFISDTFVDAFYTVSDFLENVFIGTFRFVSDTIEDYVAPAFEFIGDVISDHVMPIFESIGDFLKDVWMSALDGASSAIKWVGDKFSALGSFISDKLSPVFSFFGEKIQSVSSFFTDLKNKMVFFARGFDSISSVTTFVSQQFQEFGLFMKGISLGLRDKLSWLPGITAPSTAEKEALERERQELSDAKKDAEAKRNELAQKREEDAAKKEAARKEKRDAEDIATANKRAQRDDEQSQRRAKRDADYAKKKSDKDNKAVDDKTAREKKAEDDKKAAEEGEKVDYSDPISMLKSFGKQQKSKMSAEGELADNRKKAADELKASEEGINKAAEKLSKAKTKEEIKIAQDELEAAKDKFKAANEADKKAKAATIKEEKTSTGKAYTVEGGKTTAEGKPVGPQSAPSMTGNKIEGLGKIAAQFESGGKAGTVSTGHGDFGGKSYGAFQLAGRGGKAGNEVDEFLKSSGYADKFKGMKVGSADFDNKWKEMGNDKDFAKAQQQHAVKTHYDPQMEKLKKSGIDLSGKGAGVQEAVMSTANQYGANTETIIKALKGKDTAKMDDKEIINAIQNYKAENVKTNFKSSSSAVQAGVAKRIEQERAALLGVQGPTAQGQVKMEDGVKVKTPLDGKKATGEPVAGSPGAGEKGIEQWLKINDPNINSWVAAVSEGRQQIEAVPGVYLSYVKERLTKKPANATGTPKSGASSVTPSSTQTLEQATKDKEQEKVKAAEQEKAAAEKARTEMAQNDPRRVDKKTAPGASQETPESLLAQLNTKMDQLIQVSRRTADLNDRQLSVQKGLTSDLYG